MIYNEVLPESGSVIIVIWWWGNLIGEVDDKKKNLFGKGILKRSGEKKITISDLIEWCMEYGMERKQNFGKDNMGTITKKNIVHFFFQNNN